MAAILGRHDDARRYAAIAENLKHDFNAAFYKGDGLYENGFACGQAMALEFGLVRESEVAAARRRMSSFRPGRLSCSAPAAIPDRKASDGFAWPARGKSWYNCRRPVK